MGKGTVRVAIVEDDAEIRELLRDAVMHAEGMQVVRTFPSGDAFLAALPDVNAHVALMDINMPGRNGIECIREAKPLAHQVQYLVLTVFENPAYIFQALCAGATGYLVKNSDPDEIIDAIRSVHSGGSPMSPAIARLVVNSFQGQVQQRINDERLSDREKQVLDNLAQGLLYKEIAVKAGISVETVRKHVRHIYEKLQVKSRVEAIRKVYPR
ncbi:MAG: response regulator transcription factor [Flavobacteriales bacterium]